MTANNTLTLLSLGRYHLGQDEVVEIGEALKRNCGIRSLDLTNTGAAGIRLLPILARMLIFESDAGAKEFSEVLQSTTTLAALNLSSNGITAAGVSEIAALLQDSSSRSRPSLPPLFNQDWLTQFL